MPSQKKILLVDDSAITLMMERMILKDGHYNFILAKDGQEAIEKALREQPDLILMDVIMPKMNGFEACRRLRQVELTRSIPIIIVTSLGENEDRQKGFESGCNDYIIKPLRSTELLSKIKPYLED
ncbi:MAG: response regulator [Acidobacteriota bacterium]